MKFKVGDKVITSEKYKGNHQNLKMFPGVIVRIEFSNKSPYIVKWKDIGGEYYWGDENLLPYLEGNDILKGML